MQQTEQTAQQVRDRLPSSDARIGPLSDLTASGMAIPQTLAAGMSIGTPTLVAATHLMLGAARALLPPLLADAAIPAGGALTGGALTGGAPAATLATGLPSVLATAPGAESEAVPAATPGLLISTLQELVASNREVVEQGKRIERALTDPRAPSKGSNPSRDRSLDIYRRVSGLAVTEE